MNNTFYPVNDYRFYLAHIGNENSGRYPRGSGKNPFQHVGGRKHYTELGGSNGSSDRSSVDFDKMFTPTLKAGKDKAPISPAQKTVQHTDQIIQNTSSIVQTAQTMSGNKRVDTKSLTDDELNTAVKRLRLEAEYQRLTEQLDVDDGFDKTMEILSIAGATVGVVGGVVGIISTLKGIGQ
jgi:hypothetical protein